jgi:hypothetical protein
MLSAEQNELITLTLHAEIAEELRARGVTRSANNPAGNLGGR